MEALVSTEIIIISSKILRQKGCKNVQTKKTFKSLFFKVFCNLYVVIIKETNVLTATIKEGALYIYKLALNIFLLHILQIFFLIVCSFFLKLRLSHHPPSVSCPFSQPPLIYLQNPGGGRAPPESVRGGAAPMATPLWTTKIWVPLRPWWLKFSFKFLSLREDTH